MSKDNSWPAFPVQGLDKGVHYTVGLTKREWFAGMALIMHREGDEDNWNPKSLAKFAYECADEMLKAGEEK